MPGLWECHGHFIGTYTANIAEMHTLRPQVAAMRVTADARRALDAGFTSVREMGGMGTFLARAIEEGEVVGPNVYGSGSMLSMTAGHGDEHGMDLDMARLAFARHWGEDGICDGPDECRSRRAPDAAPRGEGHQDPRLGWGDERAGRPATPPVLQGRVGGDRR